MRKKNDAIKSGHYVYACSPRAAHALRSDQLKKIKLLSLNQENQFSKELCSPLTERGMTSRLSINWSRNRCMMKTMGRAIDDSKDGDAAAYQLQCVIYDTSEGRNAD
jgi:hypothetical protein